MFPLALLLLVSCFRAGAAETDCSNGNCCTDSQTCTSALPGAGRKFGCAPTTAANVCSDARYSCPRGYECDLAADVCRSHDSSSSESPLLGNVNSKPRFSLDTDSNATNGLCYIIADDLPAHCNCTDKTLGGRINCTVSVLSADRVGIAIDIDPCGEVAHVNLDVIEEKMNVSFTLTGIEAGTEKDVPIPGFSVDVPYVGNAGVDLTLGIDGNLAELHMAIGFNVCAGIAGHDVCGSSLTSHLPVWVLHGTYDFGSFCSGSARSESEVLAFI